MSPETAQALQTHLGRFFGYLFQAVLPILQRQSPLYWPFVVSTLVVALLFWRFGKIGGEVRPSWREFRRRFLGRALWWHPSARVDYRYYLVNAVVFPFVVGPALMTGAAIAGGLDGVLDRWIGAPPASGGGWAVTVAYTVVFFVAYDFGRFVAHSAQHDVPLLWEFHKTHHSAEVLTPFTAFRAHPIDLALMAWGSALATGLVTLLFRRLAGTGIGFYEFLQMHVLLWFFGLFGNLKHWQIWISYGRVLDHWFISPAHHQLHHSAEPQHVGRNRGFELAVWDRLYGTLALPRHGERFRMGLGDGMDGRWHRVWRLYFWPLWLAAQRLVGRGGPITAERAALRRTAQ